MSDEKIHASIMTPKKVWTDFKILAAKENTNMSALLVELMLERLATTS